MRQATDQRQKAPEVVKHYFINCSTFDSFFVLLLLLHSFMFVFISVLFFHWWNLTSGVLPEVQALEVYMGGSLLVKRRKKGEQEGGIIGLII